MSMGMQAIVRLSELHREGKLRTQQLRPTAGCDPLRDIGRDSL